MRKHIYGDRLWVTVTPEQREEIERLGQERYCGTSAIVRLALAEFLNRQPRVYEAPRTHDR